jgi:tRNA pseudouridine55 synthase
MSDSTATDGVLVVAKPPGVTSHDVVERIRRSPLAAGGRVGHAGTLDPFATGLLLVLVGRATRVQRYLVALPKTYVTRARFGVHSDTGDPTGALTESGHRIDEARVREALPALTGEIEQSVPMTSAVKVGGERLYLKARRGEQVETPVRTVNVRRLELQAFDADAQLAELEVECSTGTYIRQLVSDLGRSTGAGAYCETLERLRIGPFELAEADESRLIPLAQALAFMSARVLDRDEARRVRNGGSVEDERVPEGETGPVRLVAEGEVLAIAERRGNTLKPIVVLSPG